MGQPVHKFLEDFDGGPECAAPEVHGRGWEPRIAASRSAPPSGAQLDEAYAKGLEAGIAEGWAMRQNEIDQARADVEAQFQAALTGLSGTVLEQLSTGLARQLDALHGKLADQVLDLLVPVLKHALTQRAVQEIAAELHGLVVGRGALAIELCGPPELVERVWQLHLERSQAASEPPIADVRIIQAASVEVRLVCGDSIVETRLAEWIGKITEALG